MEVDDRLAHQPRSQSVSWFQLKKGAKLMVFVGKPSQLSPAKSLIFTPLFPPLLQKNWMVHMSLHSSASETSDVI
jgi:hypothetical protein